METEYQLPEMEKGGVWIQVGTRPKVYVVHPVHISRLLAEGGRAVLDPRDPAELLAKQREAEARNALRVEQEAPAEQATIGQAQKIDQLEAEVAELKSNTATLQGALKEAIAQLQAKSVVEKLQAEEHGQSKQKK